MKIELDEEKQGKVLDELGGDLDDYAVKKHVMPMLNITIGVVEPMNTDPAHEAKESPEIEKAEHAMGGIELSDFDEDDEDEDGPPKALRKLMKR